MVPVVEGHPGSVPHQAHGAHHGLAARNACGEWVGERGQLGAGAPHGHSALSPAPAAQETQVHVRTPYERCVPAQLSPGEDSGHTPREHLRSSPKGIPDALAPYPALPASAPPPRSSPVKGPCWEPPGAMKLRGTWGVPLTYSCGKGPLAPA